AAPPGHEARHVVVGNFGDELVLAEKVQHEAEVGRDVRRAGEMLRVLLPVAFGHIIELERGFGRRKLPDEFNRLLSRGRLYFCGFAAGCAFRRAVKPMTSHLEVKVEIRRATVSVFVDGHGTSFRVWLAMNSSRSAAVNLMRGRFVPLPMMT